MKTAIVWNEFESIKYCIVDGDWSEFEGTFINGQWRGKLQKKLSKLAYDDQCEFKLNIVSKQEFAQEIRRGAEIVECGFMP